MAKATRAEIRIRVDKVYDLLLNRIGYAAICRYASSNWNVTTRQTDRYIAQASARIRTIAATFEQTEALGKAMADYDLIFAKQMAKGDLRGVRATLDKIVELLGLSAADRHRMPADRSSDFDEWLAALRGEPREREDQSA